jgi:hypothetical protein
MSQPEWMKKYQQIGQKGPEAVTSIGEAGIIEQTADATQEIDPRNKESEDAAALFHAAGNATEISHDNDEHDNEDAAAMFRAAGDAPTLAAPLSQQQEQQSQQQQEEPSSGTTVDSSRTISRVVASGNALEANPDLTEPPADDPEQQPPEAGTNGFLATSAYAAADQDVGESWIVDQNERQSEYDETQDKPSSGSIQEEEFYVDEHGNEVYIEQDDEEEENEDVDYDDEEEEEEEEVVEDAQGNDIEENSQQAAAASPIIASRSTKVAPAPQDTLPIFSMEEQRKVILSSAKGKRSHMSPALPIIAFLIVVAAILLVVLLVVLQEDDMSTSGPSMAPSTQFLPLGPTNNGNVPSAATTRFDPYQDSCNFALLEKPNVIDQCTCSSRVSIVADDVHTRWEGLVDGFMQDVFPGWNEAITSCSAENQALLWLSSGINNGGDGGNTVTLQRFALALFYISQGGTQWRRSANWMSEVDVCGWEGVTCTAQNLVRTLSLDRNRLSGRVSFREG